MAVEIRLAIIGLIICGLYALMCTVYVCWFFGVYWRGLSYVYLYSAALFAASNPYLLLVFSTKCRRTFLHFCTCGKMTPLSPVAKPTTK